ncbi:hypothetical protein ACFYZ8_05715 [Streptomyces sp. NPDC001668]|uniref:hypothetical protein n=1 Tax=unclassified Streptomyces TaxID=2593676 RepID=UPI0036BDB0C6
MKNLAFIRLLHRQGIEQSLLPEPLSFTSVLTFHDAVEMFLIVTAEHLGAIVRDRDPFIKRFFEGLHPDTFPGGVELQGQYGIKRLNDLRNGFKHTAGSPGPVAITDAKADTVRFFEENTPASSASSSTIWRRPAGYRLAGPRDARGVPRPITGFGSAIWHVPTVSSRKSGRHFFGAGKSEFLAQVADVLSRPTSRHL